MPDRLNNSLARLNKMIVGVLPAIRIDPHLKALSDARKSLLDHKAAAPDKVSAATNIIAAIERHPVMSSGAATVAYEPVFGPKRIASTTAAAAEVLGDGLTAMLIANMFTRNHIDALMHIAFSADDASRLIRERWVGIKPPGTDGTAGGRDVTMMSPIAARGCVAGIRSGFVAVGRELAKQNTYNQWTAVNPITVRVSGIAALDPSRGCAGAWISIRGSGFGLATAGASVGFTSVYGQPILVDASQIPVWTDTEIRVKAPAMVGTGAVGLVYRPVGGPDPGDVATAVLALTAKIGECLGAAAADTLSRSTRHSGVMLPALPSIPGTSSDTNWFIGGVPRIDAFRVDGADAKDLRPGDVLTLSWVVENADAVEIAMVRDWTGERNQLPVPTGLLSASSGSWTSGPVPGDWDWSAEYELRARNLCSGITATTKRVTVRMRRPAPAFLWGVALASGQVEGNLKNDWTTFASDPNSVEQMRYMATLGEPPMIVAPVPPGVALRHDDLDAALQEVGRAATLGMKAYRLSLEWSRLEPTQGNLDTQVMDRLYVPLLESIRRVGMEPIVTLHHLTNPRWVLMPPTDRTAGPVPTMDRDSRFNASLKGWESGQTVDAFVSFVERTISHLSLRMGASVPKLWITLNEPIGSIVGASYSAGIWPPGFTGDTHHYMDVYDNLLRAHLRASRSIRVRILDAKIGIAQNIPVSMRTSNQSGANQAEYFYVWHSFDALINGVYDRGFEPNAAVRGNTVPTEQHLQLNMTNSEIRASMDFIGVNYYRSWWIDPSVRAWLWGLGRLGGSPVASRDPAVETAHVNDLCWRIDPAAFLYALRKLRSDYNLPVLITENGMADAVDRQRPSYTVAHANVVERARAEGVDVMGYLHWSIVDNWEWHCSYQPEARFGLYTVDRSQVDAAGRQTLPRRPTESALALACIAEGLSTADAAMRFGSFTDDGSGYVVPSESACRVWHGADNGVTWSLLVASLVGGRYLVWLRDSVSTRWIRLDEFRGSLVSGFSGAHRQMWGAPEREITGTLVGGDLAVVVKPAGGGQLQMVMSRDPFVGTWLGGPWPMIILPFGDWEKALPSETTSPIQSATRYVGRWLMPQHPRLGSSWQGLRFQQSGQAGLTLVLSVGLPMLDTMVAVSASAGTMIGTISTASGTSTPPLPLASWIPQGSVSWSRAPDRLT